MLERMMILGAGFLLDILFGDPAFLWHPVRGIGFLITKTEGFLRKILHIRKEREADKQKKLAAGVLFVILVLAVSVGIPALLLFAAAKIHPWLSFGLSCIMCYQMLAMKSLKVESMKVYDALKQNDLEGARYAVSMIVGRDTKNLTGEGITKAAVETVAENTSDGVIAPLLFMIFFGPLGGFFYKAVNTMDSMTGYKNDTYIYFGRAAAKLDDILNFIPARVSALCMILSAYLLGMDGDSAWKIYIRDRYCHASPNSAQTEAVCAGALNIRLAGDAYYFGKLYHKPTIGDSVRMVEAEDIKRANRLMYGTSVIVFVLGIAGLLALL
jgi:adenosylcobinamide-phosphate synthase